MAEDNQLKGIDKAAILACFLPIDTAKEVIQHLNISEQEELAKAVAKTQELDIDSVQEAVNEYVIFNHGTLNGAFNGGVQRAMELLKDHLSDDELDSIMARLYSNSKQPFSSLKHIKDVGALLPLLQGEDSQFIAVVATHLKPALAAELLMALPEEKMTAVGEGISTMGQINPSVLQEMDSYLSKKLENFMTDDTNTTDGVKNIVNILNSVTRSTEKKFFEQLDSQNPDLAKIIRENLFVFEDIAKLDTRSLQTVVMSITDNELIAKALKTASEELNEKVLQVLPSKRRKLMEEEAEGLGPIRRTDAEEAQQEIANIVKELERKKQIVIQRGEGDVIL